MLPCRANRAVDAGSDGKLRATTGAAACTCPLMRVVSRSAVTNVAVKFATAAAPAAAPAAAAAAAAAAVTALAAHNGGPALSGATSMHTCDGACSMRHALASRSSAQPSACDEPRRPRPVPGGPADRLSADVAFEQPRTDTGAAAAAALRRAASAVRTGCGIPRVSAAAAAAAAPAAAGTPAANGGRQAATGGHSDSSATAGCIARSAAHTSAQLRGCSGPEELLGVQSPVVGTTVWTHYNVEITYQATKFSTSAYAPWSLLLYGDSSSVEPNPHFCFLLLDRKSINLGRFQSLSHFFCGGVLRGTHGRMEA
eukprot:365157-Chlamydomonas_euryale.AAC.3